MIRFLRHKAEMACPWGRMFAMALAVMISLWTAGAVALSPPPGTPIINTASAKYRDANGGGDAIGNPLSQTSNSVSFPISGAPRLKITAVAGPNPVSPGATLTYTITIENTGNITATAVTVNALLSINLQFLSASNGSVSTPPAVNWNLGDISSGGSITLTITATPVAGTPSGTVLPFSVTALSTNGASDSTSLNTTVGAAPNLVLADTASVTSTSPAGVIEYTITYSNIGNIAASNVIIHNELPLGTALVAGSITGGGSIADRTITWPLGTLQPGVSGSVKFRVTVSPIKTNGDIIRNVSTITSNETVPGISNELLIPVVVAPMVALSATKEFSPGTIITNGISVMTVTLTNANQTAITGVAFTDPYPANMINSVSALPATTCGGTVTATNGGSSLTLAGGVIPAVGSCKVTVNVTSATMGIYTNSTGPVSTANAGTGASASGTLNVVKSPTVTKNFNPGAIMVNGVSTMTVTLTNPNTMAITGVAFTDTYPANMINTATATSSATNTCGGTMTLTNGGAFVSLSGGIIPASGSCSIVVPVTVTTAGTYTNNTGVVSTDNVGSLAAATATVVVNKQASLQFTKSVPQGKVAPGAQVVYTFTVTNNGDVIVTGVILDDQLPQGITFISADVTSTVNAGTIRFILGDITSGTTKTVHLTALVSLLDTAGKSITNTASVTSVESETKTASATVTVGVPLLSIKKIATTSIARPGNVLAYAIEIKNTGDVPVSGMIIRDTLPAGVSFLDTDNGGTEQNNTIKWSIAALNPGEAITLHLNVTIDKNFSETSISNTAYITANGLNELSSKVTKNITPRTPGELAFFDANWQPAYGYMSGDMIYIQVKDADQNIDPAVVEKVKVVLANPITGDTETFVLTETGPDTGIFRGSILSTLTVTTGSDGILTVAPDSRIEATYTDNLDAVPVHVASALIDPSGIVFNSITGNPISGAVVTLRNWDDKTHSCNLESWPTLPPGQVNPAVATGNDGKFVFPLVPVGDYCFQVAPPTGHTFPSVVPDPDLPQGYTIGDGSRGGKISLRIGDPVIINDIPVDPPPGRLTITKTANKTVAAMGDMIIYTLTLTSNGEVPVTGIVVTDIMPHGIAYIKKSSQVDKKDFTDPQTKGIRKLAWKVPNLNPNSSIAITFHAVVGPDTQTGDAINTVSASGISLGKTVISNKASFKIKIAEGVFTTKGTIIGRVFIDQDGNGVAKKDTGVPNAVIYLEDGTRVITDKTGKFSISGIVVGTHVLRLDETSLPKGLVPKPGSNRFMANGNSQFVDMTPGGLFKANFVMENKEGEQKPEEIAKKPEPTEESKPPVKETAEKASGVIEQTDQKVKEISPKEESLVRESSAQNIEDNNKVKETPLKEVSNVNDSSAQRTEDNKTEVVKMKEEDNAISPVTDEVNNIAEKEANVETSKEATPTAKETTEEKQKPKAQSETAAEVEETAVKEDKTSETDKVKTSLSEQILTMTPELEFLKPLDRSVLDRQSTRVLIKCPMNTVLTLKVNGEKVDDHQIGTKVKYEKGRVIIYEYIDIKLKRGEENLISAEVKDSFGIVRGEKQIRVSVVGKPQQLTIKPDQKEVAADGQSKIGVTVSVEDRKGQAVSDYSTVTVSVSSGEIMEMDAEPANDGHQILCKKGIAHFTIVAPRETGEAKIYAQAGDLNVEADIYFVPNQRPMFIVGLGEVVLGHGRSFGNLSYLKERTFFNDGTYLDGRGAFFMKGNIFKDYVLTAAFDSNKKRTDELFRESDTRLDSEDKYPAYGDESKTGYEALSRENLYVKLEKDKSYLLYGDYRTELTETRLSAYSRSFNGLKFEVNTDQFRLRSFGAHTDQSQVVDTIPGKGISGLYYLNSDQIIDGSERITIEIRDRLQPDRIIKKETKSRGSDYDIDYGMGTILFKEPIPSHDAEGNPIYIVTTYESTGGDKKYFIYGGRGAYKINKMLEIGATGIVEQNAISHSGVLGTDMTLNLPLKTIVKAEYASTDGLFDINKTFVSKKGDGWLVDLKTRPLEKVSFNAYYQTLSEFFNNPSANDAVRGTQKWGLETAYEVMTDLTIKAKYLDENDSINNMTHMLASLGVTKKFTKTTINAEVSHEKSDNLTKTPAQTPYTPGGLLNGVPFLNSYETPDKATFIKLALEREILPDLSLLLSHKQDVEEDALSVTSGGLNYKLNKQTRLYVREEYAKYQNGTQSRTLIGAESEVVKNTTVFNEYRLADSAAGSRNQQVIGLKNKVQIMEGVTANVTSEYLSTISGQKNEQEPDAYAVSAGLEYLPKQDIKITSRAEHRHEISDDGNDSYLAEMAMAYKLSPNYTLLMRERYFMENRGKSGEDHTSRLMAGLAYRPLNNDNFNALSKIEYKYNKQSTSIPSNTENAFILSTEGIYQFSRDLQLIGKYAGKLEKDDNVTSYTDMIAARIIYDLTNRFDVGAEYRMLTSHLTSTRLHGGSVEFGYRLIDQLWLSLGYSFDRFDEDLTGDSYEGEGPYLKLRFKFDEKTLKGLRKALPAHETHSESH